MGGDLNLPYADWNGNTGGSNGTQAVINSLVWENVYSQVIDSPTGGMHYWMFTWSEPKVQ